MTRSYSCPDRQRCPCARPGEECVLVWVSSKAKPEAKQSFGCRWFIWEVIAGMTQREERAERKKEMKSKGMRESQD